ncbi:MAG: type II toxin-antitoxin system RelE/ParE family toxin [bacterium]|nr:type II toxin-antitoxin system RelE/ParE family toxin [bacterium]
MYGYFLSNLAKQRKKKLPKNLLERFNQEIDKICTDPYIGESKSGDLKGVYVHKFNAFGLLYLIAYLIDDAEREIYIAAIGPHENFYRDLKKFLK